MHYFELLRETHRFVSLVNSSILKSASGDGLKVPFSQRLTVMTLTPNLRANPSWLKPSLRLNSLIDSLFM